MKITVGALRRLIKEAVMAPDDDRVMDLVSKLFPEDTTSNTIVAIKFALRFRGADILVAQKFVAAYYDELLKITGGGAVRPLGRGEVGDAYEFTSTDEKGMVLKLEPSWAEIGSGSPQPKWQDRLWGGVANARVHPMVYNTGAIDLSDMGLPGKSIKWSIVERLEMIPKNLHLVMNRLIAPCEFSPDVLEAWKFSEEAGKRAREVSRGLGLSTETVVVDEQEIPRWFKDLYDVIQAATNDFEVGSDMHAGNLGFRKLGDGRVDWVFFD